MRIYEARNLVRRLRQEIIDANNSGNFQRAHYLKQAREELKSKIRDFEGEYAQKVFTA